MDPNVALENARRAAARVTALLDVHPCDEHEVALAAHELAEAFEALDGWLSGRGFLPEKWCGR